MSITISSAQDDIFKLVVSFPNPTIFSLQWYKTEKQLRHLRSIKKKGANDELIFLFIIFHSIDLKPIKWPIISALMTFHYHLICQLFSRLNVLVEKLQRIVKLIDRNNFPNLKVTSSNVSAWPAALNPKILNWHWNKTEKRIMGKAMSSDSFNHFWPIWYINMLEDT